MFRYAVACAAALFVALLASPSQAQLVQVAPGYVRAPFVRVYSYPDGGSYVRAPFVNIYTPGYYGYGEGHEFDTAPRDWSQLSVENLRRELASTARDLQAALARFAKGDSWQRYLHVSQLIEQGEPAREGEEAAPPLTRSELESLIGRFDSVGRNAQYRAVAALPAFQITHDLLVAYLNQRQAPARDAEEAEEIAPPPAE